MTLPCILRLCLDRRRVLRNIQQSEIETRRLKSLARGPVSLKDAHFQCRDSGSLVCRALCRRGASTAQRLVDTSKWRKALCPLMQGHSLQRVTRIRHVKHAAHITPCTARVTHWLPCSIWSWRASPDRIAAAYGSVLKSDESSFGSQLAASSGMLRLCFWSS